MKLANIIIQVSPTEENDHSSSDESDIEVVNPADDAFQRRKTQKANFEALSATTIPLPPSLEANVFPGLPSGLMTATRSSNRPRRPSYLRQDCFLLKVNSRARWTHGSIR